MKNGTQPARAAPDTVPMTTIELSAFHNWCDRRCERCPLGKECPVATSELSLPPPPPPEPMEVALRQAGMEWADAYVAIVGHDITAFIIAAKFARIATEDAMDDDWVRAADTNPNVMLIERLRSDALAVLEPRRAAASSAALARFDEADRALRVWLAPFSAAIPASDRAAIAALAAAGRAPSPFSIRTLLDLG
jgi:hypothetical protein